MISPSESRERDGASVHDHGIIDPTGCPRGRRDCAPLARYAAPGFESYMCCGETAAAPVPTDPLMLRWLALIVGLEVAGAEAEAAPASLPAVPTARVLPFRRSRA